MLIEITAATKAADAALVESARAGSRAAFGALYARYRRMVHGILLAHAAPNEAEDLMQDVFVLAMRRLPGLRDVAAFGGWLGAIARNAAAESRRNKLTKTVEINERNAGQTPQDESEIVMEALRKLPDAYRETLMMRLVEGLTGPEIAERTGLQPESVRVNLCRGMKMLRELLGGSSDV